MDLNLTIPPEQLNALFERALMSALDDSTRERIISEAVKYLITKPAKTGSYGYDQPSPLQQAFFNAASKAANEFANTALRDNADFQAKLRDVFSQATEKAFSQDQLPKLVEELAKVIIKGFEPRRDY